MLSLFSACSGSIKILPHEVALFRDAQEHLQKDVRGQCLSCSYVALRTSCGMSPGLCIVSEACFEFGANISLLFCHSHHPSLDGSSIKVLSTAEFPGRSILEPIKGEMGPWPITHTVPSHLRLVQCVERSKPASYWGRLTTTCSLDQSFPFIQ